MHATSSLFYILNVADMFPGVAEVWQVGPLRVEAVLVGRPGDCVGDSLPLVRVGAAPHVVARLRNIARVGDALLTGADAVAGFISVKKPADCSADIGHTWSAA